MNTTTTAPQRPTLSKFPTTPPRTLRQRSEALLVANEIRSERAKFKRDVKAGRASVLAALAEPPAFMGTMKVFDLLLAAPKVGRVKAGRALGQCRISPVKTVAGLTERQRSELVAALSSDGRFVSPTWGSDR